MIREGVRISEKASYSGVIEEGKVMEKVWAAVFCLLIIAEYFSFYYVVYGKRIQITKRKNVGLVVSALVLVLACLTWHGWMFDFRQGLVFLVCFFVMHFLFEVSYKENIRLWLSALMILILIEGMANNFICVFFTVGEFEATIIYLICVFIMLWTYYFFIGRKLDVNMFRLPGKIKGIVAIMAVVLVLVMNFMSYLLSEHVAHKMIRVGEMFLFIGSVAICALLFSLIYYFNVTQEYSMQAEMLERQNEQQREYFEQLLKKEQDTRQFRHDLIAELLELKNYSEQKEYKKLDDFLTEMLGEISNISIRQYDVGNDIVNTIINYYFLSIRESCNIRVKGYMEEEVGVSQRDLCILISNLVKNAVEAVEKVQKQQREILFEICQGQKSLNIHVENTMEGEIKMVDGFPVTMKEDKRNHGFGLLNVKTIVKKYKGSYNCKVKEYRYIVDIFMEI